MIINKELFLKYFKNDSRHNFINMDLGIFETLSNLEQEGELKKSSHKIFTFGYLWLVSYLWKYSKYGVTEINAQDVKTILGVSPIEKRNDYIIKKDGLLDSLGFTETTKDFPIHSEIKGDVITIQTISDIAFEQREDFIKQYNSRYTCKKPLHQYSRDNNFGLMFSKDNTIPITLYEFTRLVLCNELGLEAFYVYAYIKLKSKMRGYTPATIMFHEFESVIGYKERKIRTILKNLETVGMIEVNREIVRSDDNRNIIGQFNNYSVKSREN